MNILKYFYIYFTYNIAVNNGEWSNIISEVSKKNETYECVLKISRNISSMNTLVISSPEILNVNGLMWQDSKPTVIVTQNSTILLIEFPRLLQRIDLFILTFLTVQEFSYWLNEVHLCEFWNPYGHFIVSILQHDNITEIFEISWKYYIININVVSFDSSMIGVYTYYPFKSTSCNKNFTAGLLFHCSENVPKDLFPIKVPNNFNGCKIKLLAYPFAPYVIDYSANPKEPTKAGYEVTIFDLILTRLNYTPIYLKHNFSSWGFKLQNGTYSLMYRELQKKNADMVFGLALLEQNTTNFEVLDGTIIDNIMWIAPSATVRHAWINLFHIYTPEVWVFVICSIFINGFIWWIFAKNTEQLQIYKNLPECVVASMYIYLQGSLHPPNTSSVRILFAFWLIYCLVLYTAHQSILVSTLTKPQYDKEISSIDEMLDSELQFGFFNPGVRFFQHPTDPHDIKIRSSFSPCPMTESCLNRTAFQRDFATIRSKRQVLYLTPKMFSRDGRPLLHIFGPPMMIYSRYVLIKGNPVIKQMNGLLNLLFSNGLITKWQDEVTFVKKISSVLELSPLTVPHLTAGFLYLFVGLTLASLVFITEIMREKYQWSPSP